MMHVADIMPTLLEVAGATYPTTGDRPPLIGKSWVRYLAGEVESPRTDKDYMAWEVFGDRAIRQGDWKLRWQYKPFGKEAWELFNVAADPAERADLAAEQPDKVKELLALWDDYVEGQQRDPAESLALRGHGGDAAGALPGGGGLSAAHLQEAVRAARRDDGGSEALIPDLSRTADARRSLETTCAEKRSERRTR